MKIFWSYSTRDDQAPARRVSKLRRAFEIALSQAAGEDCSVLSDKTNLPWGVKWRDGIEELIRESDGYVAVVTPSYFNSRMCIYELEMAVRADKQILPILFRKCRVMRSTFKEDGVEAEINKKLNRASRIIAERQARDFREHKNKDVNSEPVQDFLDEIADEIV